MKKITLACSTALVAAVVACLPAGALPTYEPFSEYANAISNQNSTYVATYHGAALNAVGQVANAIDLATNLLTIPSTGEMWTALNFSGTCSSSNTAATFASITFGTNSTNGIDICVVSNTSVFTYSALSSPFLLPSTFPGFPAAGGAITNILENPAQPVVVTNGTYVQNNAQGGNVVGNSAVLTFASDITRPVSGSKSVFISFLFNVAQFGQLGTGNDGRIIDFVAQSNLVEGIANYVPTNGVFFKYWDEMFNNFNSTSNRYVSLGMLEDNATTTYFGAADSSTGKSFSGGATIPTMSFGSTVYFVVAEYTFNPSGSDTMTVWVNPGTNAAGAPNGFGGPTVASGGTVHTCAFNISDIGGLVIEDRNGADSAGGAGTNYMANLMLGSTWSYVTGGPEFTSQPSVTSIVTNTGSTISLTASAAAAGQTVSYQWVHVVNGVTNTVNNGPGGAGGAATVSGATSTNLVLAGISNGDTGAYLLQATASSTGFELNSTAVTITADPDITSQPQNTSSPQGGSVSFSITATTATPPLTFQWQINGAPIFNGTQTDGSIVTIATNGATCSLTINNVQNAGTVTCAVTNGVPEGEISSPATITIVPDPAITVNPSSATQTVNYGAGASFTASAETVGEDPLVYAWYFNGTMLVNGPQADGSTVSGASGTTGASTLNATLTLGNLTYLEDGNYVLWVTNNVNHTAASAAGTLTVNDPAITNEPPATVQVELGNTTTISVGGGGSSVTYQWYGPGVGGPDVSGANSATLTISGAQMTDAGSYYVVLTGAGPNSPVTSTTANVIVENAVTGVTVTPGVLTQNVGSHLALLGTITGGSPSVSVQWQLNGVNLSNGTQTDNSSISGASATLTGSGTSTLILSNLQVADTGTYTLVASNAGGPLTASCVVTVSNLLYLSSNNIVVTRVGDGNQALSGVTGNTLYLDQYTTSGQYVSTIMVPDEGTNVLLVPGAGSDWMNESYMTQSSNGGYLNFTGYFQQYPSGGTSVTAGGTSNPRVIGAVNAFGIYVMAYTNEGIDSGGGAFVRDVYSTDGLTNFWLTGAAGSGAIKYVNAGPTGASYATGTGVPALSDAVNGPICIGLSGKNLVYTDSNIGDSNGLPGIVAGLPYPAVGLDIFAGTPESNPANGGATNMVYYGSPADFAFSPDQQTLYFCDAIPQSCTYGCGQSYSGGIQRYDWNGSEYVYSYTLQDNTVANATNGLRGLTVYFPPSTPSWGPGVTGAVLYATTAEQSTNRIIDFTDDGLGSPATLLATAGPNQFFRGIRFGPTILPITVSVSPAVVNTYVNQSVTLTASVNGDAPLSFQWYTNNGVNSGAIPGATGLTLTLSSLQVSQSGTYTVQVSNLALTNSASAVVSVSSGPPTLVLGAQSLIESVGDHTAFSVEVVGSFPITYQWYTNGGAIPGATGSSLVLTNIQVANSATYTVVYQNMFGTNSNTATLQVTAGHQVISSRNLMVARVGDGAQALSDVTGNTLYLDQFTTAGTYSNTIMVPDNAATNLIISGGPANGPFEAVLSLATNGQYINFCGYDTNYPNSSSPPWITDASNPGAGTVFRSIGAVNGFGVFTIPQVNETAYIASPYAFDSVASLDGLNEFWGTGDASAGGLKYLVPATAGAAGGNIGVGGSGNGTRVAKIVNGNVVYSDAAASPAGLYGYLGLPIATATANSLLTDLAGRPADFAASPDTVTFPPSTSTVYLCDQSPIATGGGIQRYDWNGSSYALSYTLGTGGQTNGASCLTVDFSANSTWGTGVTGAIIYATTTGASSNQLIKIIDNGAGSSPTILRQANQNEILRGVTFGPVVVPPAIATNPASLVVEVGQDADFSVVATGTGPLAYQWYSNSVAIGGATGSTLSILNTQMTNAGTYTVTVANPAGTTLTSTPATLTVNPYSTNSDLVAWYRFDDGSGLSAADSTSYANTATLQGFPNDNSEWVTGLGGGFALNFANADNNADNVVIAPDAPQLAFTNNLQFTLACWINGAAVLQTNTAGYDGALISKGYGNGGEQFDFDIYARYLRFFVRNSAGTVTAINTTTYPTNAWEHVAATFDGSAGVMVLYTNGQVVGSATAPGSLLYTTLPVAIGNRTSANGSAYNLPYYGEMQDVRIYNVALSQADVAALYSDLAPPTSAPAFSTNVPGVFVAPGQFQLTLSGSPGAAFRLWSTPSTNAFTSPLVSPTGTSTLTPVTSTWTLVTNGTFGGGGTAVITDLHATNSAQIYMMTQP